MKFPSFKKANFNRLQKHTNQFLIYNQNSTLCPFLFLKACDISCEMGYTWANHRHVLRIMVQSLSSFEHIWFGINFDLEFFETFQITCSILLRSRGIYLLVLLKWQKHYPAIFSCCFKIRKSQRMIISASQRHTS